MAKTKSTATPEATAAPETTAAPAKAGPKYSIEVLGKNCRTLFGVSTSTFAGATLGMKGKYSVEEMKTYLEKWKKVEVK